VGWALCTAVVHSAHISSQFEIVQVWRFNKRINVQQLLANARILVQSFFNWAIVHYLTELQSFSLNTYQRVGIVDQSPLIIDAIAACRAMNVRPYDYGL